MGPPGRRRAVPRMETAVLPPATKGTDMREREVVVGMDGSVAAFRAMDAGALEAQRRTAVLEVVHCVADPDEAGPVLRAAAARLAERHPALAVRQSAVVGDPVDVLAERSRRAELTVVGTRGAGGLAGLLTHSVSRRLAARVHGPLLVVRGARPALPPGARGGGVLLGLESDDDTEAALFAFEEAALRGGRLTVLHAWSYRQVPQKSPGRYPVGPVLDEIERRSAAATRVLGSVVAPLRESNPGLTVHTRSVRATPCRVLIEATGAADLLVLASHRRWARPGRELGTVIQALLRHSRCPVVIVPVSVR
jgi:nucleotide-binding universal stress UspA family protein